ncbi:MAG: TerC family protein [Neisseria sp.]|nr:TerC family protein [Neisseria sp.]
MQTTYPDVGSPLFYTVFAVAVLVMIGIDMLSLKRQGVHQVRFKEAVIWSTIWVAVSCAFALWLYFELAGNPQYGTAVAKEKVMEYFTAYVLEKSLAVDNIFVFLMIFAYFKVPNEYQHRVLLYGVLGAIVMRVLLISVGVILVQRFSWILYIFGAFLVFTGIKMLLPEKADKDDLGDHFILRQLKKILHVSPNFDREKFFTIENGKRVATPLFLVLLMVEMSDIIFAVDSIPAVFAVTTDPFILITSNIFAILGLRAMYFLLAGAADRFVLLQYGLAFVLTFIGVKMLVAGFWHIPIAISLSVVFGAIGASMLISLRYDRRDKEDV